MATNIILLLIDCENLIEEERDNIVFSHTLKGLDGEPDLGSLEPEAIQLVDDMNGILDRLNAALEERPPEEWVEAAGLLGFALTQTTDGEFWMHETDEMTSRYETAREAVQNQA